MSFRLEQPSSLPKKQGATANTERMRQDRLDRIVEDLLLHFKGNECNEEEIIAFLSRKGLKSDEIDLLMRSYRKFSSLAIPKDVDPAHLLKEIVKVNRSRRIKKTLKGPIGR